MPVPFLRHDRRNPVTLPDGTVLTGLVYLDQVIDHPNWKIGAYSYHNSFQPMDDYAGLLAPYLYRGAPETLEIGKFCQIAEGVRFITSSANHPMSGFSTYPFAIFRPESLGAYASEIASFGDTTIGHDVWIGHAAMILPGVTIGDGAIIGAGAVVAKDIPPYAVAAGNPARVMRLRFAPEVIETLVALRWWDWPIDLIGAHLDAICGADIARLERAAPAA